MAFDNPPQLSPLGAPLSYPHRRHSVCPHDCPSTCALEVEVLAPDRIGGVYGAKDHDYTAGVLCAKVSRYAERVHNPDRVTRPLRCTGPRGSGQFEEISWDEALDIVAHNFAESTAKYGSESVWPYFFAGTMGLIQRDGINRLRHEMRYSGMSKTICTFLADAGWGAGVGKRVGPDSREMQLSDLIVVWGGNPVATQVQVMSHVTRARKNRGAKLVVIDPYRTGTADAADMHLALRPGTDGALACAVMHCAFRDGLADLAYIERYVNRSAEEIRAHLADKGPAWASAITGLSVQEIEDFAALYNRTQRSYIRCGYGFSRSRNGAANLHAVTCLPAITGAWQHEGGGIMWGLSGIYGWDKTMIEGLDVRDPSIRILDMSRIGAILTGDRRDLGDGPGVHAMLIQNTNPAVVAPNTNKVREGFAREDLFVCVHEQVMTETAKLADIVLPATMFLEHDDLYQASGHSYFQVGPKLIDPPGEARPNHYVHQQLAKRLGAKHPGNLMSERELIDWTLKASGKTVDFDTLVANHWHDDMPDFRQAHFLDGFSHADGKFHFAANWQAQGPRGAEMPSMPDHFAVIDQSDAEHPFRLVAAPARQFLNSTFTETPTSRKREVRPSVLINPSDAEKLGIADGDMVELGNRQGVVSVHAKFVGKPGANTGSGMQPGVVVVESLWWNADFEGGIGVNALTSDEPGYPNGGAVFHDTAVWIRKKEVAAA